jgi:hypothetical protein
MNREMAVCIQNAGRKIFKENVCLRVIRLAAFPVPALLDSPHFPAIIIPALDNP